MMVTSISMSSVPTFGFMIICLSDCWRTMSSSAMVIILSCFSVRAPLPGWTSSSWWTHWSWCASSSVIPTMLLISFIIIVKATTIVWASRWILYCATIDSVTRVCWLCPSVTMSITISTIRWPFIAFVPTTCTQLAVLSLRDIIKLLKCKIYQYIIVISILGT